MHDLRDFGLKDMAVLGSRLRTIGAGAPSLEAVAQRVVKELRENLRDGPRGPPACPLVRFYKTHPYGQLPRPLQGFAAHAAKGPEPRADVRCLTLMATAGDEPAWNDRRLSQGHQAIPLQSEEMVAQAPMISNLFVQFGVPVRSVLRPDPETLLDLAAQTFNVFHVAEALGSPHIPAQQFVESHEIRSALGFGGILPSGNLFAIILFSRVPITNEVASLFRTQALTVKVALLPHEGERVFEVGA